MVTHGLNHLSPLASSQYEWNLLKLSAEEQLSSLRKSSPVQMYWTQFAGDTESSIFPKIKDNELGLVALKSLQFEYL